jgi:phosphatidate cytidylyltransferase
MGTRIVTGTILAVLAFALINRGGVVYFAVMAVLAVLSLNEFYRLLRMYKPVPLFGFAGLALVLAAAQWGSPQLVLGALAAGGALAGIAGMAIGPRPGVTVRMAVTFAGIAYIGLGFAALLLIRLIEPSGDWITAMVIFGAWGGDTLAYFTGKWFGATPMTPKLSPKKTWEGFLGGLIGTVLIVVGIGLWASDAVIPGAGERLLLGLVIGMVGPLGDLFESLLKRDVQIKDSGRGLPGHGGVLDRFDALLWAAIASYFLLTALLGF